MDWVLWTLNFAYFTLFTSVREGLRHVHFIDMETEAQGGWLAQAEQLGRGEADE